MTVSAQSPEGKTIRKLFPLSSLSLDQFNSLCNLITVEYAASSTFLFTRNDISSDLIYLLKGVVSLQADDLKVETIKAESESARFAIAHQIPRKIDAYAKTAVSFLRLNLNTINALPSHTSYSEEPIDMITDEVENDDDWMTTLLKSPIFKALPPANLQQILISLEQVTFEKGESIIKQGEMGDYYYLILKGQCLISRRPSEKAKEIKLGKLQAQDTFGEDSLITDNPRNVSITALSFITLLRLNKEKFISLIKTPSLQFIEHSDLPDELIDGAILLDVRAPDEYNKHHLPHSINAPFFSLRMQLKSFTKKKKILVICDNGKTSEAAAFLLLRNKFDAVIVKGGMNEAPQDAENNSTGITTEDDLDGLKPTESEIIDSDIQISIDDSTEEDNEVSLLQKENQALKQTIQSLSSKKEELEQRYRALYKQTEKLKSLLDKIKQMSKPN